jgi:DNA-binding CsgD family transcriptional regulator
MEITSLLPAEGADRRPESGPERRRARAAMVMDALTELIPWDGYALCAWDITSGGHRHTTLAAQGYSTTVQEHMNDAFVDNDPAFAVLHTRTQRGLCWRDLSRDWNISVAGSYTGEGILMPAGFREGMTRCLRTADGRYTGALHVSWSAEKAPPIEVFETIESFRSLLADACDLLKDYTPDVLSWGSDDSAFIITSAGQLVDVPGMEYGRLIDHPAEFRLLWHHLPATRTRRFLWTDPAGGCRRIELVPLEGGATLVKEAPTRWPFDLTRREAQVLHLVAAGASNPVIGAALFVSHRTVASHVENILRKLACSSRSQLAAVAAAADIYLLDESLARS